MYGDHVFTTVPIKPVSCEKGRHGPKDLSFVVQVEQMLSYKKM